MNKQIDIDKPKYNGYSEITCETYCKFRLECEQLGLNKEELDKAHVALFYGLTLERLYSLPITTYNLMLAKVIEFNNKLNNLTNVYYQHNGKFYYLYLDIDNMKVGHFADLEHIETQFPNIWNRLPNIVSMLLYTEDQLDERDTLNYNGNVAMSRVSEVNQFPISVILGFHNLYIQKKKTLQIITQRYIETVNQLRMLKDLMIEKQLEENLT